MPQAKYSLTPSLIEFLDSYKQHGFKSKSAMVRSALRYYQEKLEQESVTYSADLYAEVYAEETELFELTETAVVEWPE